MIPLAHSEPVLKTPAVKRPPVTKSSVGLSRKNTRHFPEEPAPFELPLLLPPKLAIFPVLRASPAYGTDFRCWEISQAADGNHRKVRLLDRRYSNRSRGQLIMPHRSHLRWDALNKFPEYVANPC